jgi:catechol-2,3-dioxygenase
MLDRPLPRKLGHLVLNVRDIQSSVKFYTEIVGLQVSDWISDQMVFLRCGSDHHDLALAQIPPDQKEAAGNTYRPWRPGVEHFSYELASLEEVEQMGRFLQEKGVEIVRGIGKHGPGENVFLVFKDPDGNFVEFYCDMTQIPKDRPHQPKVWPMNLDGFDQWHFKRFLVPPPEWGPKP